MPLSENEMLHWIQKLSEDGVPPTKNQIDAHPKAPSSSSYYRKFGSMNNAFRKAGCETRHRGVSGTDHKLASEERRSEVFSQMREMAGDGGSAPTSREWDRCEGMPSAEQLSGYFGSYNAAVEEAGLEPNRSIRSWSKDEIIEFACKHANSEHQLPAIVDFDDIEQGPSSNTVFRTFDDYNQAVRDRGYDVRESEQGKSNEYSREELLGWIDAFVTEFGIVPTSSDMREGPMPSPMTYKNRFESIAQAIQEAGYEPRKSQKRHD